ncbi:exported hypothetical protein [Pseudomonas sp. IT-P294]
MRKCPNGSLKKLLAAFTVLGVSTTAVAYGDNFASLTLGQTSDKIKKSHTRTTTCRSRTMALNCIRKTCRAATICLAR